MKNNKNTIESIKKCIKSLKSNNERFFISHINDHMYKCAYVDIQLIDSDESFGYVLKHTKK